MTPATSVPRPDRHLLVLDTAVGAFLTRPDLAPRSRTVYGQTLTRLIADLGPQFPVAELSGTELSAFLQRHYGHAAPATWNLNLATLHSFLAFCTRHGALQAGVPPTFRTADLIRSAPEWRMPHARTAEEIHA
jgi:hypothetical protein